MAFHGRIEGVVEIEVCDKCGSIVLASKWDKHMRMMHPERPADPTPTKDEWLIEVPNNIDAFTPQGAFITGAFDERDHIARKLKQSCDRYDNPASIRRELSSLFSAAGLEEW